MARSDVWWLRRWYPTPGRGLDGWSFVIQDNSTFHDCIKYHLNPTSQAEGDWGEDAGVGVASRWRSGLVNNFSFGVCIREHSPHGLSKAFVPHIFLLATVAHLLSTPTCCPTQGCFPCHHSIHWNDFVVWISRRLRFTINSATSSVGRSMSNGCQTLTATIWCGWLAIWTRYVAVSLFPTPLKSDRLSIVSILEVPVSRNVYANLDIYVAPG